MKKAGTNNGKTRVTFEIPAELGSAGVSICGDFNNWSTDAHRLKRRKDGSLSVTISLPPGRYEYRYLLEDGRWENDWSCDGYAPNPFGSDNSVVEVEGVDGHPTARAELAPTQEPLSSNQP